MYVLLGCYFDPDGNLVDDSFVAVGSQEKLREKFAVEFLPAGAKLFEPGERLPEDEWEDHPPRMFRLMETSLLV